jgi:hypothetical protein
MRRCAKCEKKEKEKEKKQTKAHTLLPVKEGGGLILVLPRLAAR